MGFFSGGASRLQGFCPRSALYVLSLALAIGLLAGCGGGDGNSSTSAEHEEAHFGYGAADGPAEWASLDPAYAECGSGNRQSPIDLKNGTPAQLPRIDFAHTPSAIEEENNGHSIQLDYEPGSSIEIGGVKSELQQFHFHAHSENTLNGRTLPLEFHFVYEGAAGKSTVIAVFAKTGAENSAFNQVIDAFPQLKEDGDHVALNDVNPEKLMPPNAGSTPRWSYQGSLTTPPCTEGLSWQVLNHPVEMSQEQIDQFTSLYDHNTRPVQPLDGRQVLFGGA